jgi:ketosteroid isomerase-like protein
MNAKSDILRIVNKIKESWLAKQYDEIANCLAEDVIMAAPGSSNRIKGKEAYILSYRDYDTVAKTHQFKSDEPQIDVIGDVAISITPFAIRYELKGNIYDERGRDILILARQDSEWRVVWRTMQTEPA